MTPAEAGDTRTHEKYIRLPNGFDYETFFQQMGVVNESVIQIDFNAAYDGNTDCMIPLKFVYYANSNHEKRIPSLGPVFDKYDVISDDVVWLESRTINGETTFSISFKKSSAVKVYTSPICYETEENELEDISATLSQGCGSLQQIFYGAPGTGKSNKTNEITAKYPSTVRTTFHPDSDYSTFVGAYKPTMEMVDICDEKGQAVKIGDVTLQKEQITYKFVKQAFLKAYIQAWKQYQQTAAEGQEVAPQFLMIEEINRGNCAQIFGDLFQLLDRKNGFSEYPIEADEDIRKCLLQKDTVEDPNFGEHGLNLSPEQKAYIDNVFDPKDGTKRHIAEKICKGQVLVLPPNLHIWATMNTSDQSLFPIDSAFKRRWDWKYMRITNHTEMAWRIKFSYTDNGEVLQEDRDWWEFLLSINKHIKHATHSEDKQLGYFFCKANADKIITAETFVGKVVFYLWNDVFKTSGYKKTVFKDMDFDKFYLEDATSTEENPDGLNKLLVHNFIENVVETAKEL